MRSVRGRWRWRPAGTRKLLVYLAGAALFALFWQGLLMAAEALFPETATVGYGTVELARTVKAAFLRRETLVAAPADGRFHPALAAGVRVPRFGAIGEIRGAGETPVAVIARYSGLVAYGLDPKGPVATDLPPADPAAAMAMADRMHPQPPARGRVRRGDPVARLVDDLEQYVLCRLAGGTGEPAAGQRVWIREDGSLIPLTVAKTYREQAVTWLLLRTERFPASWLGLYTSRVELVTARYVGTTVPRRYLHQENGQWGLTVMVKGRARFTPVKLRGTDGRTAAVEGAREGDIILPR